MASSPATSTTVPTYAPTADFLPSPLGFGAQPCAPCHFTSTAATYPPHLSLGGYYTSTFPYFYGNPPAFPQPPPASAYTPASSFSPNQPTWPPPAPDPTLSTAPSTFPSSTSSSFAQPTSTSIPPAYGSYLAPEYDPSAFPSAATCSYLPREVSFPTPACESTMKDGSTTQRDCGVLRTEKSRSAIHSAKLITCQDGDLTKGSNTSGASIHGVHKHRGHGTFSKANASTNHRFFMEDEAAVQAAAGERVPAKNTTRHGRQRKLLKLQARLDEQQARDRAAINTLQGQLVKLKLTASQIATAMGMQTTEVPATESSPIVASTPSTSPATTAMRSSDTGTQVSSSVSSPSDAPQMFDERPTQHSVYEKCWSEHHNPFQSTCPSTLSEQNLGSMFDAYDDDMDGCSTGFFDVFIGTPERQKSDQFANCFREASENEIPSQPPMSATATDQMQFEIFESTPKYDVYEEEDSACLTTTSNLQDFTIELQQQNDERAGNCSVLKASNSFVSKSSQLNIEHSMRERRLLWDPGAAAYLMTPPNDGSSNAPVGNEHVGQLVSSTGDCFSHGTTKLWFEYRQQYIVLPGVFTEVMLDIPPAKPPESNSKRFSATQAIQVIFSLDILLSMSVYAATSIPNILVSLPLYILWDPGDTKYHALFTIAAGATKLHCVDIYKPRMVQIVPVQFRARWEPIFESAMMCSYAFGLGWTEVNIQQLRDPSFKVLVTHERRKEWDPHINLSSTPTKDIVGFLQDSILPRSANFILNDVLLVKMQFGVPKCCVPEQCYCQVPPRLIKYGIQVLWDPGILNQMFLMRDKSTVRSLAYSGQTTFKQSNFVGQPVDLKQIWALMSFLQSHSWYIILTALLQVHYCCMQIVLDCLYSEPDKQLVCYSSIFSSTAMYISTATSVCIRLVLSSGKIAQEEKDVAAIYQVLKIQLLMRKTAHIWDPGIEPILFLYKELHVHKIQQVHCSAIHACYFCVFAMLPPTQMLDAYTVGFLNGQGEFLDQQGVQRNYSAKHLLLFSDNYLQLWELDIIFITFLPP